MMGLLDRLREKPKPQRQMIVLFSSLAITAVIAFIWLSVLLTQGISERAPVSVVEERPSSFGFIRSGLSDLVGGVQQQFDSIRQSF